MRARVYVHHIPLTECNHVRRAAANAMYLQNTSIEWFRFSFGASNGIMHLSPSNLPQRIHVRRVMSEWRLGTRRLSKHLRNGNLIRFLMNDEKRRKTHLSQWTSKDSKIHGFFSYSLQMTASPIVANFFLCVCHWKFQFVRWCQARITRSSIYSCNATDTRKTDRNHLPCMHSCE